MFAKKSIPDTGDMRSYIDFYPNGHYPGKSNETTKTATRTPTTN
jgi:hypothetical protein